MDHWPVGHTSEANHVLSVGWHVCLQWRHCCHVIVAMGASAWKYSAPTRQSGLVLARIVAYSLQGQIRALYKAITV